MSDAAGGGTRGTRRRLGRRPAPRYPIELEWRTVDTGLAALLALEQRTSESLCVVRGLAGPTSAERATVRNHFGATVRRIEADGAGAALAHGTGAAMTGRRVAVFLPAADLPAIAAGLRDAVDRRLPLLVYAVLRRPADRVAWDAIASAGALIFAPRNAQHAVDLALVARHAAERALVPAVLLVEGPELAWALQDHVAPVDGLIDEYLGDPSDRIPPPTEAEVLLFGAERRRVPRWFDLDRPVAHAVRQRSREAEAAEAGRRIFFGDALETALDEAVERFEALTGRRRGEVHVAGARRGRHRIVAWGAAVEVSDALCDHLPGRGPSQTGTLGVDRLRPFPVRQLAAAAERAERITVLAPERGAHGSLWLDDVRAALPENGRRLVRAWYGELGAEQMMAVAAAAERDDPSVDSISLGIAPTRSDFPRRESLLQRLRRFVPRLDRETPVSAERADLRPRTGRTVTLYLDHAGPPLEVIDRLRAKLLDRLGRYVRSRCREVGPDLWRLTWTASGEPFPDPGDRAPADVMWIDDLERMAETTPLRQMTSRGRVLVATTLDPQRLADALPNAWRTTIGGLGLSLYRIDPAGTDAERRFDIALDLLDGEPESAERVPWQDLIEHEARLTDPQLPAPVRRFGTSGTTYDNVPRFWGEFALPRLAGEADPVTPDPYLALGSVPPVTATFHDNSWQRDAAPVIDPARCTGCGRCWSHCPDSAISALAVGGQALLDLAADRASGEAAPSDERVGKLRRAHKQWAARVDSILAGAPDRGLDLAVWREAFDWLLGKLSPSDDERRAMERMFESMASELDGLPLAVTSPFFRAPHAEARGSGELLMLAVNPQACQGCGVCAAVCNDAAIEVREQTVERVQTMRRLWASWEALPDTPGSTIARVSEDEAVGPLPAILMSRHTLYAMTGGDGAEPGSGQRLATRQIGSVFEFRRQQAVAGYLETLAALDGRLRDAIREELARGVPGDDLEHLDRALSGIDEDRARAGALLDRLEELGERTDLDLARLERLVRTARDLERLRWKLAEGEHRLGRARYGLLVAGESAAAWAGCFPRNPFVVPVAVDLAGEGPEIARGLVEGLMAERLEEARTVRRAELLLEAPADLVEREAALDSLTLADLSAKETALCPPVLLVAGPDGVAGTARDGLIRLLTSKLPVKVLLLDDADPLDAEADPTLLALACREAFVLSASIAHGRSLFAGASRALEFPGPALMRVHAPSPRRHGFDTARMVERAATAVEARVHPLLSYDPRAAGVFGTRIDLEANPDPEADRVPGPDGAPWTVTRWAAGERRFRNDEILSATRGSDRLTVPGPNGTNLVSGEMFDDAERRTAERWAVLRELGGLVSPFTEPLKRRLGTELEQAHRDELARLRAEYEQRLAAADGEQQRLQAQRLRSRLMQLAGYDPGSPS